MTRSLRLSTPTGMRFGLRAGVMLAMTGLGAFAAVGETLPWADASQPRNDAYSSRGGGYAAPAYGGNDTSRPRAYVPGQRTAQASDGYANEPAPDPYRPGTVAQPAPRPRYNDAYSPTARNDAYPPNGAPTARQAPVYRPPSSAAPAYQPPPQRYGANRQIEPYEPNYGGNAGRYQNDDRRGYDGGRGGAYDRDERTRMPDASARTYSRNEVVDAGHRFFGSLSSGLAKAIEYVFQTAGRPNGYILGEDAGGAFVAGLRYGEGRLYTKHAGVHRVFWQGPSIGYDFGGDGARTMTLVYNLRSPNDVYRRFGGVQGSAYIVGGASVQLLKADDMTLAPIRTGVGLRLGANIGYLKYTRRPTWNPF